MTKFEQFLQCIRYFNERLLEDFLSFVPVHDVSGLGLATTLKETLEKLGLDLTKLYGQRNDRAAAIQG